MIVDKSSFFIKKTIQSERVRELKGVHEFLKNHDLIQVFIRSEAGQATEEEKAGLAEYVEFAKNNEYTIHMIVLCDCYNLVKIKKSIIKYMDDNDWSWNDRAAYFQKDSFWKCRDLNFYKLCRGYFELEKQIYNDLEFIK
ncbi:hypothetical protein CFI10_11615 [Marinobacterium iners]|uniref:hypothetical protein n=1 Tax=Marinobacterium iners TaxID=48076 RepID=UPI001A8DA407|nr:hypothetical protein [Marinobacterium iners]QSR35637.1 hypothetical protein CFI10_11615 [Marinobacterium iners]